MYSQCLPLQIHGLNLRLKSRRIPIQGGSDRISPHIFASLRIHAFPAIAPLAVNPSGKTIAVKFETLGLLAVAAYLTAAA